MKKPHTEIALHGAGTSQILELLRKKFTVEILDVDTSSVDKNDETIELRSTDWWRKNKHRIIAGARYKIDMTQKELAKQSGIRQSVISEYERGKRRVTLKAATKLATVLNTTPEHLMV
ncbi:MAG: helix-turn-helix transcriptional regulator [Victivallales bacterium]|nr:helix-turn-helix transcriptional regulator [Victivallales bacterium]